MAKMLRILLCICIAFLLIAPCAGKDQSCKKQSNRKRTLKLIKESSFFGLFRDLRGHTKFEGSDVIRVRGKYYVVFDR